jgi:hypothetical protein
LKNPQETDPNRLSILGSVLKALAAKMKPQAAAEIATRVAQHFAAALENPQETDSYQLSSLGRTLAALASKMEPQAVTEIAKRCAQRLVMALKNPQETGFRPAFEPWWNLGGVLRATAFQLVLAISNLLLPPVSEKKDEGEEQPYDRQLLTAICG